MSDCENRPLTSVPYLPVLIKKRENIFLFMPILRPLCSYWTHPRGFLDKREKIGPTRKMHFKNMDTFFMNAKQNNENA
jgi:hypothetical protein